MFAGRKRGAGPSMMLCAQWLGLTLQEKGGGLSPRIRRLFKRSLHIPLTGIHLCEHLIC